MEFQGVGNSSVVDFAQGFIHGLQRNEDQPSQCATDITRVQNIINDLVQLWSSIFGGSFNFSKFIMFFVNSWSTLVIINNTCHLYPLIQDIVSLINPIALFFRVMYIVFVGSWTIVPAGFRMIYSLIFGPAFNAGLNLGRIFKTIFEFQIE